jgi:hypothetical protein
MTDETLVRILITAPDKASLTAVLREQGVDFACTPQRRLEGGAVSVEAFVPKSRLEKIRGHRVKIDVLDEDASATMRARQAEVGRGNRFREEGAPKRGQRGLGRKIKDER